MAFNTNNPLGSTDPRDLSDNSENFDKLANGTDPAYADRLGNQRKSFACMESEFASFIAASGYEFVGNYAAGITITGYQQVVKDVSGEFWRLDGATTLPYTTTGAGLPEGEAFLVVGDAVIRQELSSSTTGQGSDLVAHTGTTDTVTQALDKRTIYVGSVAELEALSLPVGTAVYLTEEGRAGEFVVKSGTPPSDPQKGIYIVLVNGNYAERKYSGELKAGWFGGSATAAQAFYESISRSTNVDIFVINKLRADILYGVNRLMSGFTAEKIRRNAGVPIGMDIGIEDGVTVGTTGALTSEGRIVISSEADLQAGGASPANSGTGTFADPYVISNAKVSNTISSTSAGAIYWNDSDANYYLKLKNCEFSGFNSAQIITNSPTTLFVESCEVFASVAPATPDLIGVDRGSVVCDRVLFSGLNDSGTNQKSGLSVRAPDGSVSGGEKVRLENCRFNKAKEAWAGDSQCIKVEQGAYRLEVVNCEASSTGATGATASHFITVTGNMTGGLFLSKNDTNLIRKTLWVPQNSAGNDCIIDGAEIEFCRMNNGFDSHILIFGALKNANIKHCDFLDVSVVDKRTFSIQPQNGGATGKPKNVKVHHCKFTKNTGDNTAGNEVLESFNSESISFEYNWITSCPEDGFEHVNGVNCNIRHCVADNCAGQIADYFGEPTRGGLCEYIYGDCGDVAVILTDVNDVTVGHVFAKNTGAGKPSVLLEQRDVAAGAGPNNCNIIGPLPLAESSGSGSPFATSGTVGTDNTAVWFERGEIKTYGSVDLTKFDPV